MSAESQHNSLKREFILAGAIFVAMAVVGAIFALWFVFHFGPQHPAPLANPR